MPVQVSYPGVYIQEISSGSRTITGVSTSVALFVGMAEQGPMDTPVRTLSLTEFERTFGATNSLGELHDQVAQFYLNGGSTAWIMRIADATAEAASISLENQDGTEAALVLTARSKGIIGNNFRAIVDYNTPTPEMTFNLTIQLWGTDTGGNPVVVTSEQFKDLSMDPNHGKYAVDVLTQNSTLMTASDPGGITTADGYTVWGMMEMTGTNDNLVAALAGGNKFMVSVDGGPFQTAILTGSTVGAIESAIQTALNAQGVDVTVVQDQIGAPTYDAYRITVVGGRRIRFARAVTDDIAAAMHMTADLGALEVDRYSIRRPAPNGYFSNFDPGDWTTTLGALAVTSVGGLNSLSFDDSVLTPQTFDPSWTGTTMALATASTTPTLKHVLANLDVLVASFNGDATLADRWTAARHGHRVVFTAKTNGDEGDLAATLTAAAGAGFDNYFNITANVTRYRLGSLSSGIYEAAATLGFNGDFPEKADYDAAYPIIEREVDLFNLLILPRADGQGDNHRAELWGPASVFAKSQRAFLLVDPPSGWIAYNDVADGIADLRIGVATDHAAVYWPRIKVSSASGTKPIDPAGAIAGVMARTDASRGVWKAPAGLEANLLGVRGVERPMSDGENGVINPLAVNAIRAFPNGIVSWGARTMVGFDNSGNDDYKYVPVRRLALYIEESLYRGLQWAVFEPNDEPLWRQIRQTAGAFMNNLFRLGAFAGAKSSDAYFVKVDRDTTTQNDVNLGIVNVLIGFAPLKPAEFVVITLQQKAGEVQT